MTEPLPSSLRSRFRAVAEGILPPTRSYREEDWARAEAVVEAALRQRPRGMLRQLHLFLRVVDLLPLLSRGRTLRSLPPGDREAFLGRLQDSRFLPIRRGVWGLRTLALMGHYARPETHRGMGYDARLRGRREHPDGESLGGTSAGGDPGMRGRE
jgi:hypothetical protein